MPPTTRAQVPHTLAAVLEAKTGSRGPSNTCSCPSGKKLPSGSTGNCENICPPGATSVKGVGTAQDTCACPRGQEYTKPSNSCLCPSGKKLPSGSTGNCEDICPPGATFIKGAGNAPNTCDCPRGQDYVKSSNTCACPTGQKLPSSSTGNCENKCPDGSTFKIVGEKDTCDCSRGQDYTESTNSCGCPNGKRLPSGSGDCEDICPAGSEYVKAQGEAEETCKCARGQDYTKDSNSCDCPSGKKLPTTGNGNCEDICPLSSNFIKGEGEAEDTCECTPGQVYTKSSNSCDCPSGKKLPTAGGGDCEEVCPTGSTFVRGQEGSKDTCECTRGRDYDEVKNSCDCPSGKTLPSGSGDCTDSCPTGSTFLEGTGGKEDTCVCTRGRDYDKDNNSCDCPSGKTLPAGDSGNCTDSCPTSSTFLKGTGGKEDTCICTRGRDYDKVKNTCDCPAGKTLPSGNGDCTDIKACPTGSQTIKGTRGKPDICLCSRGQDYNAEKNTCGCPPGKTLPSGTGDCAIVKTCPVGSQTVKGTRGNPVTCLCSGEKRYNNVKNTCECPTGTKLSGSKCVTDCGSDASFYNNKCNCKKVDQVFDTVKRTCSCPTGQKWNGKMCYTDCGSKATWNKYSRECVCNKEGQKFKENSRTCDCPTGLEWYKNQCQVNCGGEATYSRQHAECLCHKADHVFTKSTKTCACAKGFALDPRSGKCKRDRY